MWAPCSWPSRSAVVVAARDGRPHRHRVDQQAHHRFRAGHLGRPTRDRGAEDDIVLAGQPAQQLREGALQHGVHGGLTRARQLADGPRELQRTPKRCHASRPWHQPLPAGPHQGGGVKTGQHLPPGRARGIQVPTGQPGHKPAIWDRRRQPLPVIAGEYFPQQDRQRPAIEHDVVIGEHKPVPIRARCGSTRPERPAASARSQTAARSAAHIRWICSSTSTTAAAQVDIAPRPTGSAAMICTGSSNRSQNRATRCGCRVTTACTASRRRSGSSGAGHRHTQLHRIHIVAGCAVLA